MASIRRTRSMRTQANLEFPVKKSSRVTRIPSKLQDIPAEKTRVHRKRGGKENDVPPHPPSPCKQNKLDIFIKDKENACVVPQSPMKFMQSPIRQPLTPRKDPNIMSPVSLRVTPMKKPDVYLRTPGKENSPHINKLSLNVSPRPVRSLFGSPLRENLATPEKYGITKGRALTFDSPSKNRALTFISPSKGKSLTVISPSKSNSLTFISPSKSRALNFDSPSKNRAFTSPSKRRTLTFDSPLKSICSPKSKGTPRPVAKPITSPLRLARQEGVCYQRAKQALHTAMPQRLVCREKETATVNTFLDKHLSSSTPGSLYISGAPGTGKTAVLTHTLATLKMQGRKLVYINCMSVRSSQTIYNKILGELKGKDTSLGTKQAQAEVEKMLTSKGQMIVLVLDEMDQLDSKNQEILYTMFEWPSLAKSKLILLGIANALDLTDRILPRLQARPKCRPELLNFSPYTRDQIVCVLQERLKQVEVGGESVLEPSALRFCAAKVATVAGDMRKALDVCRRAVEIVEAEVRSQQILTARGGISPSKRPSLPKKIGVPHVLRIINEVYGTRVVARPDKNQTIPLQQKLVICSVLLQLRNGKSKEVTVGKLHDAYKKVCVKQNVASVDQSEFLSMCTLVESRGILGMKRSKDVRTTKVFLKLDEQELESALQDKTLMCAVLKNGV